MATAKPAADNIGAADLSDPVQRRFANLSAGEQDEWRVLLHQPGVYMVVTGEEATCQVCRQLVTTGQLARRDMFAGPAAGITHANPRDCPVAAP